MIATPGTGGACVNSLPAPDRLQEPVLSLLAPHFFAVAMLLFVLFGNVYTRDGTIVC